MVLLTCLLLLRFFGELEVFDRLGRKGRKGRKGEGRSELFP